MRKSNKKELKEQFIEMYLSGKNYKEIGKLTGWSRTFVSRLIQDDERIINYKKKAKIKVSKQRNGRQLVIYIPPKFIATLGISNNKDETEYVEIIQSDDGKVLTIKKHS